MICHSQGAEFTFDAWAEAPSAFVSITALELSGYPTGDFILGNMLLCLVAGDFLDVFPIWRERHFGWLRLASTTGGSLIDDADLGPGNSHVLMQDRNSVQILSAVLSRIIS